MQETLFTKKFLKNPLKGKEQEWQVETLTKMGLTILGSKIPRWVHQKNSFHLLKRKENKMGRTLTVLSWSLAIKKKKPKKDRPMPIWVPMNSMPTTSCTTPK
jgi:hypothetical protein